MSLTALVLAILLIVSAIPFQDAFASNGDGPKQKHIDKHEEKHGDKHKDKHDDKKKAKHDDKKKDKHKEKTKKVIKKIKEKIIQIICSLLSFNSERVFWVSIISGSISMYDI